MGGFLIAPCEAHLSIEEARAGAQASLNVFRLRGLRLAGEWVIGGSYLAVFAKRNGEGPRLLAETPGRFAFTVGTPLSQRSLDEEHRALLSGAPPGEEVTGAFATVVVGDGVLRVHTDRVGTYPLFRTANGVVASSFLAARAALSEVTVDPQGFYEYVLGGATYGETTYLNEVKRLAPDAIHRCAADGSWQVTPRAPDYQERATGALADFLDQSYEAVRDYFALVANTFGDSIAMGITGGFDSRLMLAALTSLGVRPQVFVRGGRASSDVQMATTIAQGEGLPLSRPNQKRQRVADADMPSHLGQLMLLNDAVSDNGAFGVKGPAADRAGFSVEFEASRLMLSGGGGEIFRDYWELPARSFDAATLISHGFRWKTHERRKFATGHFEPGVFYARLEEKLLESLGLKSAVLSREQVALAYPFFRVRHWTSSFLLGHHPYKHALLPFADVGLAVLASSIPVEERFDGALEAKLIARFSPKIAAYPSGYGHSFDKGIPLRRRASGWLRRQAVLLPDSALLNVRDRVSGGRKLTDAHQALTSDRTLASAFGSTKLRISDFYDVHSANESEVIARALTVEAVLQASQMIGAVSGVVDG